MLHFSCIETQRRGGLGGNLLCDEFYELQRLWPRRRGFEVGLGGEGVEIEGAGAVMAVAGTFFVVCHP